MGMLLGVVSSIQLAPFLGVFSGGRDEGRGAMLVLVLPTMIIAWLLMVLAFGVAGAFVGWIVSLLNAPRK